MQLQVTDTEVNYPAYSFSKLSRNSLQNDLIEGFSLTFKGNEFHTLEP